MKKAFLLFVVMIIGFLNLYSQNDNSDSDIISQDELFAIQYSKKSAAKAMLMSAVFPGAGQFYVNPRNFTTYLFPLVEIGLWYGYFKFNKEGDEIVSDYKKFADIHYRRLNQYQVQKDLILQNAGDIYTPGMQSGYNDETDQEHWLDEWGNGAHFNLDYENTQHYYEDIGKYNQYIFGWNDWYDIYATLDGEIYTNPRWEFDNGKWIGMEGPTNPTSDYFLADQNSYNRVSGKYSGFRAEYISMRRDAENTYDKATYCSFGLVLNHIAGALDALRVTKAYNLEYASSNKLKIKFAPVFVNNRLSPALYFSKRF